MYLFISHAERILAPDWLVGSILSLLPISLLFLLPGTHFPKESFLFPEGFLGVHAYGFWYL